MGSKSHMTPHEFSMQFNVLLRRVVEHRGGRATARWAEQHMPKERGKDYWDNLFKGKRAMTTEDIAVVAAWLRVSPFAFVRAVRAGDPAAFDPADVVRRIEDARTRGESTDIPYAAEDDEETPDEDDSGRAGDGL